MPINCRGRTRPGSPRAERLTISHARAIRSTSYATGPLAFPIDDFSTESEKTIMATKTKTKTTPGRPLCTVISLPDPDNLLVSSHGEQGGTLQWRTDTHNYPRFEIRFDGANPSNSKKDQVLSGSDLKPVVILLKKTGDFNYTVRHFKNDGTFLDTGPIPFRSTPCPVCPPII
jgi:hypothetical protein